MTIGSLSRRTGVPVRVLRQYEDREFIYTAGSSTGYYRLFGEEAMWCVEVVRSLPAMA
jgi:DNA-binding transcriptional MerR regulator